MTTPASSTNFRQSELDKFAELANRWWDPEGPQKPLHALNPVRLDYVAARRPLAGARALDGHAVDLLQRSRHATEVLDPDAALDEVLHDRL